MVVEGNLYLPSGVQKVPETVEVAGDIYCTFEATYEAEDVLRDVSELGLDEGVVKELQGMGVRTKMDLIDFETPNQVACQARNLVALSRRTSEFERDF